jgi:uncharacterized protein involved in propanediol utilization
MAEVSRSTQVVASNVVEAQGTAAATADLSAAVQDAAQRMDEQTSEMQERVADFVLAIQSGTVGASQTMDTPVRLSA